MCKLPSNRRYFKLLTALTGHKCLLNSHSYYQELIVINFNLILTRETVENLEVTFKPGIIYVKKPIL